MNCKPGDLAINVGGTPEADRYRGEIYLVLRRYLGQTFSHDGPAWWVQHRGEEFHCIDACLRPLRDDPGTDEMLRIAGLPQSKEVPHVA